MISHCIVQAFWILCVGFWTAVLLGFIFTRLTPISSKIGEKIYNYRLALLKRWPYTVLRQAVADRKVVTGAVLIAFFLVGRSVFMLLFGIVFVSPAALFVGGFLTPSLLTLWKSVRALVWSFAIVLCEFSGYALAASIGVAVGWSWIVEGVPVIETMIENQIAIFYGSLAVVGLQIAAAVLEAVAVIWLRIPGIPLDALLEQ
jgi:hypothetical protein